METVNKDIVTKDTTKEYDDLINSWYKMKYTGFINAEYKIVDDVKYLVYVGKIYEDVGNTMRYAIKSEVGTPVNSLLLCCEGALLIDEIEKEGQEGETIYYEALPELIPEWKDHGPIASIYSTCIKEGIVVESCRFVRTDDGIFMHMPRVVCRYNSRKKAKHMYFTNTYIADSIPEGLNPVTIMRIMGHWGEAELRLHAQVNEYDWEE